MYFSKNCAQETRWGSQRVWQRGLRETMAELWLEQVTFHIIFRPHKATCNCHVSTFPRVVLRGAQTSNCTWRSSWLSPTAPTAASGRPPSRYFLWHQCIRPDYAYKNSIRIVVWVHFSVHFSTQLSPEANLELTGLSLQQYRPSASGQLWLQGSQAACRAQAVYLLLFMAIVRCNTRILPVSSSSIQTPLFEYLPITPSSILSLRL